MRNHYSAFVRVLTVVVSESMLCLDVCHADWPSSNKLVCGELANQTVVAVAPDNLAGSFLAWQDMRNGNQDVFAQHVNALGALQWPAAGVPLCTATGDQRKVIIAPDGAGGAIFAWQDVRGGSGTDDVCARRINASGVPQWTADGVAVCASANKQTHPIVVSDGVGGGFIVWEDKRSASSYDTYAQHINAAGAAQWTADGVAVCTAAGDQLLPVLVRDAANGVIITWQDGRSGV